MKKRKRRWKGLVVLGVLLFLASFLHFGFGLGRSTMTTTAMPPAIEEESAQSSARANSTGSANGATDSTANSESTQTTDSTAQGVSQPTGSSVNGKSATRSTTGASNSSGSTTVDSSTAIGSSTGTTETEHLYGTTEAEKLPGEVSVHIKENQIYWNAEPIELAQLAEKLSQLNSDQQQVKLVDQQAKRVVYQQVEEILQENGFIIIRTTQ